MPPEYKRSPKKKLAMDHLQDISLPVSLELGHKLMRVQELLELTPGRIVKLDRLAGEPVDLVINGKIIAKGEVAVIDENFAVRIIEILGRDERLSGGL